jgi:hypothetical protein
MKKYYLAGPMSGYPHFNFPAFDKAAAHLRELGYTIVSPAELDRPEVREASMASLDGNADGGHPVGDSWGDFLSRDVKLVADEVSGIIALPGWQESRGARLEMFVAMLCGHELNEYVQRPKQAVRPLTYEYVAPILIKEFLTIKLEDLRVTA